MQTGSQIRRSVRCALRVFPWGPQNPASPGTLTLPQCGDRSAQLCRAGIGRSSQMARGPGPRRAFRPPLSRVDRRLEGRNAARAGGRRRLGAGGRGPEGGAGRSAEQGGDAGRPTRPEERGRCLPGKAAIGLLEPKQKRNRADRVPAMEEQGSGWG